MASVPAGKLRLEVVGATAVDVVVAYEHAGDARKQLSQSLRRERVHAQGRTPETDQSRTDTVSWGNCGKIYR